MRSYQKWLLFAAIASISVVVAFFMWRVWKSNYVKKQSAAIAAGKPQLIVETGHNAYVHSIAFSPDGKILASGSQDRTVKLWDAATGTEIRTLIGHTGEHGVWTVTFSPDGKILASGGWDKTVKLWDVATGTEIRTLAGHTDCIRSVAFSPEGKLLASGGWDETVKLWDVATGTEIRTLTGQTGLVVSVAFSPDGKMLASNSSNTIKLWDAATGTEIRTLTGHINSVNSVAFSPDGKTLASGSGDKTVKLWNVATGTEIRTLTGHDEVSSIAFSPDGKMLASDPTNTIKLWDAVTGREIRTLTGHTKGVGEVAFSPDNKILASASDDETVKLWDIATGTEIRTLARHTDQGMGAVAFSPDGRILARVNNDETVKLWDAASGTEIRTLARHTSFVQSLAFSPDGKTLASGSWDKTVKLWDAASGREIRTLTGHTSFVASVAFSPDGKILASGSRDSTVKLWDVATGTEIRTLIGHDAVSSVAFSPDGKILAAGSMDNAINLWGVATGTEIRTLAGHTASAIAVAFSPDGKTLASGSFDSAVKLWDVATGTEIRTLTGHTADVWKVVFSPDGKTLASGSGDSAVKLWDVATSTEIRTLAGHTHAVESVAFSPDSKTLISSDSFTIKLWDMATNVELASLVSFGDGSWVLVMPDGHFDTNRIDDIKGLHWLMPDAPLTPLPIEIFMRDYYEPKLLPRILAREQVKPVRDFSTLNRTQPEVQIVDIALDSAETMQVTVEVANAKSVVQKDTSGKPLESGVYDVRLFRDGQLVGYAPEEDGEVSLSFWGENATLKFSNIKWPRTGVDQVEFSAYAFNSDRIKSATDRKTYTLTPKPTPVKGRAYIISLGINAYEREGLNLRYAANDARQVQENLTSRLATRGEYEEVISLPLVSDYEVTLADGRAVAAQDATLQQVREGQKRVTENRATKAHLRAVLDALAGREPDAALLKDIPNADKLRAARPEDLVLLSISSHGYTDSDGIFYIVPSDTGAAAISSPEFRSHCVSSDELSRWLRDVDAGELVMIVDACHSAAAVKGTDFKPGPMGSRGLGQLSYDKGMRILTATQADNVALEANKMRQGLLIYALLEDGLSSWLADYKPQDKSILLTEWLGYGVERVPRLYEEVKTGQMQISAAGTKPTGAARIIRDTVDPRESDNDKTQQPSLFDFARRRREIVLARQP